MKNCISPLKCLRLSGREVVIESKFAEGNLSIVYKAYCGDKRYILKELYPEGLSESGSIIRLPDSSVKVMHSESLWEKGCDIFIREAELLKSLQKNKYISDYIVNISGPFFTNGTIYTLSPWTGSVPWDMYEDEPIEQIIEVSLRIAEMTQKFHEQGYIAVDIKPSNYIISRENNRLIVRTPDLNAFIKMSDISQDTYLMYSDITAAPEYQLKATNLIGPHSDVYSITMMLFRKLAGDMQCRNISELYRKVHERIGDRIKIYEKLLSPAFESDASVRLKSFKELSERLDALLEMEKKYDSYL